MDSILDIIDYTGDSELIDYHYNNSLLTFNLEVPDLNKEVKFEIKTNHLITNIFNDGDSVFKKCFVKIEELSDYLTIMNNIYIPNSDFGKMMREVKSNYNLAYGLKQSNYKYMLSLIGHKRLLSCVIKDISSIIHDWNIKRN